MFQWEEWFGDLLWLSARRIVRADRSVILLTEHEAALLGVLAAARGNARSRSRLLDDLRGGHAGWRATWEDVLGRAAAGVAGKCRGCTFEIVPAGADERLGYRLIGWLRVLT